MPSSGGSRLLAVVGVLLACSCWISAFALFGYVMGENFSEDPAEQARLAAARQVWTAILMSTWLLGIITSSAIAGLTVRTNRILAILTWVILSAFVVFAVVWGR